MNNAKQISYGVEVRNMDINVIGNNIIFNGFFIAIIYSFFGFFLVYLLSKIFSVDLSIKKAIFIGFIINNALIIYTTLFFEIFFPNFVEIVSHILYFFELVIFFLGAPHFFLGKIKSINKKCVCRYKNKIKNIVNLESIAILTFILLYFYLLVENPIIDSDALNFFIPIALHIFKYKSIGMYIIPNSRVFGFPIGYSLLLSWFWILEGEINLKTIKMMIIINYFFIIYLIILLGNKIFRNEKRAYKFAFFVLVMGIWNMYFLITPHYPDLQTLLYIYTALYFLPQKDCAQRFNTLLLSLSGICGSLAILFKYHALPIIVVFFLFALYKTYTRDKFIFSYFIILQFWLVLLPLSSILFSSIFYYGLISIFILLFFLLFIGIKKKKNDMERNQMIWLKRARYFIPFALTSLTYIFWNIIVYIKTGFINYPKPVYPNRIFEYLIEIFSIERLIIAAFSLFIYINIIYIVYKKQKMIFIDVETIIKVILFMISLITISIGIIYITSKDITNLINAIITLTIGASLAGSLFFLKAYGFTMEEEDNFIIQSLWIFFSIAFSMGIGHNESVRYFIYIAISLGYIIMLGLIKFAKKIESEDRILFYCFAIFNFIASIMGNIMTYSYEIIAIFGFLSCIGAYAKRKQIKQFIKTRLKVAGNTHRRDKLRRKILASLFCLFFISYTIETLYFDNIVLDARNNWFLYRKEGYDTIMQYTNMTDVIFTVGFQGINLYTNRNVIDLYYSNIELSGMNTVYNSSSNVSAILNYLNSNNVSMAILPDGINTFYHRYFNSKLKDLPFLLTFQNPLFFESIRNIHNYLILKKSINYSAIEDLFVLGLFVNSTNTLVNLLGTTPFNRSVLLGDYQPIRLYMAFYGNEKLYYKNITEIEIQVTWNQTYLLENRSKRFELGMTSTNISLYKMFSKRVSFMSIFNFTNLNKTILLDILNIRVILKRNKFPSTLLLIKPLSGIFRIYFSDNRCAIRFGSSRFNIIYTSFIV